MIVGPHLSGFKLVGQIESVGKVTFSSGWVSVSDMVGFEVHSEKKYDQINPLSDRKQSCQEKIYQENLEGTFRNGILLPKLFWPNVRKNCSSDL